MLAKEVLGEKEKRTRKNNASISKELKYLLDENVKNV